MNPRLSSNVLLIYLSIFNDLQAEAVAYMKFPTAHKLRLYSGLIIAVFLVMHLLNAALGLASLEFMDSVGRVLFTFWSNPLMLLLLYGAFLVHIVMGLVALFRPRSWKMPLWNVVQIVLGLAMPYLLIRHAASTRGADVLLDIQRTYSTVVNSIWSSPDSIFRQYTLVAIAWVHLCLGIHFWLRHKAWYSRWTMTLYPLSLFIPILAGLGFARAGVETWQMKPELEAKLAQLAAATEAVDPASRELLNLLRDRSIEVFFALVAFVLLIRWLRDFQFKSRGAFRIVHTNSEVVLKGNKGQSILEVLRSAGVSHAAVCGGRGRCTTCRVRVMDQNAELAKPSALEASALQRVGAGPNVRLACQLRPDCDITITPLLQPDIAPADAHLPAGVIGHEQQVACMFVDMRGSTSLGEKKLPYDVVFILNHFFIQLAEALRATSGHYANFTGDGVMGLYGLDSDIETACRDALRGAVEIQRRMDKLNHWLIGELDEPLQVGIGIHCGLAIVGTMGPPDAPATSAIGDTINIAARLEALTKQYTTNVIVSETVLINADMEYGHLPKHSADVHGRGETVDILCIDQPALFFEAPEQTVNIPNINIKNLSHS